MFSARGKAGQQELKKNAIVFFVLFVLGFMLYSNVLQGEFTADDYPYIIDNYALRDIGNINAIWQSFRTRFLPGLTFALNYAWGKHDVAGYHIFNILLHIFCACSVFLFCQIILRTPGFKRDSPEDHACLIPVFAALIFLCHPIQTQAVSYIMQRMTSMGTLFYLLTLIFYIRARIQKRNIYFAAAFVSMFLGVFCKEMIITVPAMLLFIEVYFLGFSLRAWKARILNILPFIFLSTILLVIFLQDAHDSVLDLKTQIVHRPFDWNYLLTEINVLRTYLRLWVLPVNQNHHYAYPMARSLFEPATLYSFFLLIGLLALAVRLFKAYRLISFAIVWFFVAISVEFTIVCFVKRGVIYEHWLYLATAGFAFGVSAGFYYVLKNRTVYKGALYAVVVLWSLMTYQRNFVWQNEIIFWEDVFKKSWRDPIVYLGIGTAYQRKGFDRQALDYFEKGLKRFYETRGQSDQINRYYLSGMYNNLGLLYWGMGRNEEALKSFKRSYHADPKNAAAFRNLAKFCMEMKQYDKVIFFLKEKIRLDPLEPEDYYGLGIAYLHLGKQQEARVFFQKAYEMEKGYGNDVRAGKLLRLLKGLDNIPPN